MAATFIGARSRCWDSQIPQHAVTADSPSLAGKQVSVHVVPEGEIFAYDGPRIARLNVMVRWSQVE